MKKLNEIKKFLKANPDAQPVLGDGSDEKVDDEFMLIMGKFFDEAKKEGMCIFY